MASEAWSAAKVLHTPSYMPFLAGTLGIAIRRGEVPGLRDFLLTLRPDNETLGSQDSTLVRFQPYKYSESLKNQIYFLMDLIILIFNAFINVCMFVYFLDIFSNIYICEFNTI